MNENYAFSLLAIAFHTFSTVLNTGKQGKKAETFSLSLIKKKEGKMFIVASLYCSSDTRKVSEKPS